MTVPRFRRCQQLMIELRTVEHYAVADLLAGGTSVVSSTQWVAVAPHLDAAVVLDEDMLLALGRMPAAQWTEDGPQFARGVIARLCQAGLVFGDGDEDHAWQEAERALSATSWWTPAAVMHRLARWQNQDSVTALREAGLETAAGLCRQLGPPPPACAEPGERAIDLVVPAEAPFDAWLKQRATCRNFDRTRLLDLATLSQLLWRVFASHGEQREGDDAIFLKKNVPSAGGLHPTEAFLLVQSVLGLEPGLYRYDPIDHSLSPVAGPVDDPPALARRFVAGQQWFADAHVQVILAPRFARTFWKYREHPKAYRAVILDVGHASQLLLSCATEARLGAFVTAAINEQDIEQVLELDPMQQSPMAICGIGWRSELMTTSEFDPGRQVWQPGT
ncbi:putative peptide maturation dehydrogenase [Stenotrophomonas cyclobalanopsidis]|uniref:putative peptide maturation dehydrogenase n=1 Tax=Stenotrophomonas cyclobalanopsidis TaxID=2771362 RepID=UPI0034606DB0